MSSTIGHAMCGVACLLAARGLDRRAPFALDWRHVAAFAVLANLPDADFLLGLAVAGDAHRFHSGASHSLAFALAAAALVALAWRRSVFWRAFPWISVAIASHAVVDLFAGPKLGFNWSFGVPLLWPFDDTRMKLPFTAFLGVEHSTLDHLVSLHNLKVIVTEIVTLAPPLLVFWWLARLRGSLGTPLRSENQAS